MLNKILRLISIFLLSYPDLSAQNNNDQGLPQKDTIIIMNKQVAKRLLDEYGNMNDLNEDIISDLGKEAIITDRPHVAETPFLVPKSYLQWESGFQFQKSHASATKVTALTYNNLLIRIGFSRRVEGRIMMNYLGTNVKINGSDSVFNSTGFSGLSLGSKVFLVRKKGLIPLAFIKRSKYQQNIVDIFFE
jgi:hypothetical protein